MEFTIRSEFKSLKQTQNRNNRINNKSLLSLKIDYLSTINFSPIRRMMKMYLINIIVNNLFIIFFNYIL